MPLRRLLSLLVIIAVAIFLPSCNGFFVPRTDTAGSTAKFLFVANFNGGGAGTISSFTVNQSTGALTVLGSPTSSGSAAIANGPTSLVTASSGKFLYSANDGGSVSAFTIDSNGALAAITGSPFASGANANAMAVDPSSKFLYVASSGANALFAYNINSSTGELTPVTGSPFSLVGLPFGVTIHPSSKFLYAAMDVDGTAVFTINTSTGALTLVRTVPPLGAGKPQAVLCDASGKFLYAADGVAGVEAFSVNSTSGDLTAVAASSIPAGKTPVALATDRSGKFLYVANLDDNNVSAFAILTDGTLSQINGSPFVAGTNPTALGLDGSGKFFYVANFRGTVGLSLFTLDTAVQGKLLSNGTANTGTNPAGLAFR